MNQFRPDLGGERDRYIYLENGKSRFYDIQNLAHEPGPEAFRLITEPPRYGAQSLFQ